MSNPHVSASKLLSRLFSKGYRRHWLNGNNMDNITPTQEIFCALDTICKNSGLSIDDLIITELSPEIPLYTAERNELGVFPSKVFPIDIPVDGSGIVTSFPLLQKTRDYARCVVGIYEFYCCYDKDNIVEFTRKGPERIQFWTIRGRQDYYPISIPALVIKKQDYSKFHKIILKRGRIHKKVDAPILPKNMLSDLYENTIGFLKRGHEAYKKYNIPFKRGVILAGPPGNGKTLICRWLIDLCKKHRLLTKVVTFQEYRNTMSACGGIDYLFNPFGKGKKGIIFFDDLDVLLTDRKTGNAGVLDFLSGLDGIHVREGVVFVFATNEIAGLDEAAIRPNRIDLFLRMNAPDIELRKEFINKKFPKEIIEKIDLEKLANETDEISFAELEEIRRLFCIDLIEKRDIDLDRIINLFKFHRKEFPGKSFGFRNTIEEEAEYPESFTSGYFPTNPNEDFEF